MTSIDIDYLIEESPGMKPGYVRLAADLFVAKFGG